MSAYSNVMSTSTTKWNFHSLDGGGSTKAFLSKPHLAYPAGFASRAHSSASNLHSHSSLSARHRVNRIRKRRSLSERPSFRLGSSGFLPTLSDNTRRRLIVTSAVDSETGSTQFMRALASHASEFSSGLLLLTDTFVSFSTGSFLNSLAFLTTTLVVSSAFYAYSSREKENGNQNQTLPPCGRAKVLDGWLNLSKATPFSKYVTARCPSLAPSLGGNHKMGPGAQLQLEGISPEYQRLCLHADDGGTVALDWPSHLDWETNKELENVLLIIPGSIQGSEERGIGKFTGDAEKRGYFPVVLNPRGCGESPLTTPRVFSGADSDDVRLAVEHISKRRPWATIMGIGWGLGANMLTKYLGEESYTTPLTAAVCIDNPYNLDVVTKSGAAARWNELDRALTTGLVKVLDANKKLFQGGSNGFDVNGGLAARSLRQFETAITAVAHGYDSLEKFYDDASSESSLERVQIPLLCIQHTRDYFEHSISFSQSVFYNQPYLMLLVPPSEALSLDETGENSDYPGLASDWSHGIALEWLAAVEVALLRGRHPLLDVTDLTIKPGSKEWSPVGSQIPSVKSREKLSTTYEEAYGANQMADSEVIDITGHISDVPESVESDTQEVSSSSSLKAVEPKAPNSSIVAHSGQSLIAGSADTVRKAREESVDKHSKEEERRVEDGNTSSAAEDEEVERGQVQLAAENVMKVLDVTMPGTLSPEQKQQVVEAVGRGESLVGALQEAVPEDVRGTMATAVSAAVQAKGISFKTAGIKPPIQPPKLPDQFTGALSAKDATGSTERKGGDDGQKPPDPSETKGGNDGQKAETHSEEKNVKASPSGDSSGDGASGDEVKKGASATPGEQQTSAGDDTSHSDSRTKGDSVPPPGRSEDGGKGSQGSVKGDSPEASGQESGKKTEHEPETTRKGGDVSHEKDHSSEQGVESKPESEATSQNETQAAETTSNEKTQDSSISNAPVAETQGTSHDSPPGQAPGSRQVTPVPSVGQALQALTGFDDATQMAVTNVFGVVENVLDQLEKENPAAGKSSTNGDKEGPDNSGAPKNGTSQETSDSDSEGGVGNMHSVGLDAEKDKKGSSGDEVVVNRQSTENGDIMHRPERPVSSVDKNGSPAPSSAASHDVTNSLPRPDGESERRLAALAAEVDQEAEEKNTEGEEDTNPDEKDGNMIRDVVLNALKFEVVRRLGSSGLEALGIDFEEEASKVAHAVSEAAKQTQDGVLGALSDRNGRVGATEAAGSQPDSSGKLGVLNGNIIIQTLSTALGSTSTLGRLVPLGVLVGAVLAALGAVFLIVSDDEEKKQHARAENLPTDSSSSEGEAELGSDEEGRSRLENTSAHSDSEDSSEKETGANHGKLMGAMTAAMGATAAVASQKAANTAVHSESNVADARETDGNKEQAAHGSGDENGLPKFVPDIAEKAISLVSPVVPKKDDGEVDQDRLVAMLAEIGQKGGVLRLVGKAALLWGGLRGAMSLADRLLGFLRIKERPLPQRMLGFLGMAVLLWTPVLVPLLPTLLQQWATKSPGGVADAAAGVGLYGAVFILITIWGKRVRDYDRPLVAYGLELLSRAKLGFVAVGMAVGVNLVAAYYGINWALGFASIRWTSLLVQNPSFPGPAPVAILTLWHVLSLLGQSVSMALIVALVEELLFRAWLQEEIAVDLGQHEGILLSAVAFAVVHWSPQSMVGLWFLSVALAGARARMDGDLSLPIGIHAGIVAAYSFVSLGGLAYFSPSAPAWLTGAYAGNPLAGAIGTAMVAALAIVLYPRNQELPPDKDDDYYHLEDES